MMQWYVYECILIESLTTQFKLLQSDQNHVCYILERIHCPRFTKGTCWVI